MAFDPDKFLAEYNKGAVAEFDPDEFLREKKTMGESATRGALQGLTLGFADELAGLGEAALDKFQGKKGGFSDLYAKHRDESRKEYDYAKKDNAKTYTAGELGGGVGTMLIPGLNAAKGASVLNMAGKAALAGGLYGAGESKAADLGGIAEEAGKGAAFGLAGGVVGASAGKALEAAARSKMAQKLTSWVASKGDRVAENIAEHALGVERGTRKSLGDQKVREAARYALDEGIVSANPFVGTKKMIQRNEAAMAKAGNAREAIYNAIDDAGESTFNPLNVAAQVDEKVGGFWRSPINKAEEKQLENTLESIMMRGEGNIPLKQAQALKEEIGKVANWKNSQQLTDKERMARDAYGVVRDAIEDATKKGSEKLNRPGMAEELLKQNRNMAASATTEQLLANKMARSGNRMVSLTDFIVGAGGAFGGPIGALKAVAAKKALERLGPSMSAIAVDRTSKLVRKSPELAAKLLPMGSTLAYSPGAIAELRRRLGEPQP